MPTRFQQLKDAIVAACHQGRYDLVQMLVQEAWDLAAASNAPADAAEAHWCAGLAQMQRESSLALTHFDAAYAYYRDDVVVAARLQANRGSLLARLGQVAVGAAALTEAEVVLREHGFYTRLAPLLVNRSDLEARRGQFAVMLAYAREAEQVALACSAEAPAMHAYAIMAQVNQAYAAMFLGDHALATSVLDSAYARAVEQGFDDLIARVVVNQAHLLIDQDHLLQALHLLQVARTTFSPELTVETATLGVEEAQLYARLGMVAEGYRAARAAADLFATYQFAEESVEAALLALRLALTAERSLPPWIFDQVRWLVRDREAVRKQALRLVDQISPPLRALLTALQSHPDLQVISDQTALLAQADAAVALLDSLDVPGEAIQAGLIAADLAARLRREPAPRYRALAERATALGRPGLAQQALEGLAEVVRGRAKSAALQQASDLAASMRRAMPVEELKARALASQSLLHARLVEAYLAEGRAELALMALLQGKGEIWVDVLTPRQPVPPDPQTLPARTALLFWGEQLREATDEAQRAVCLGHLRAASASLWAARPARPPLALPTLADVQAQIPSGAVAVEYMLGPRRALACVFTQTSTPRWVPLGKTAAIRDVAERLALRLSALAHLPPAERHGRALAQRAATDRILAELHLLLIEPLGPIAEGTPLILAPDGALADLPWAACYDPARPTAPYLGQRHRLSLVPSLAVLALAHPQAASGPPLALGWADAAIAAQVSAELASYAAIFPQARIVPNATRADLDAASGARMLHISAHGRLNPRHPLLSAIMLADGPVLLADVFNLNLSGTLLAVLSACETSAVAPLGGLALALSGSFLTAGVTTVVAGLWQIDATATQLFVEACYRALACGLELAIAIQQAQASVRDAGYDHPYYWAALQPLMRSLKSEVRS